MYLGFLVAKPAAPCTPSWGGYYILAAAQQALNLDERIAQVHSQGGTATVIEDTESTIDLTGHGWTVHNYTERLSYSATPPDFGSLCIQRHRWANAGLLIVPKLWQSARQRRARGQRPTLAELFLRLALNAVLAAYAIVAFVGLRNSLVDIWMNVVSWLRKPPTYAPAPSRSRASAPGDAAVADWELVLYLGFADRRRAPREDSESPAPRSCRRRSRFDTTRRSAMARSRASPIATPWRVTSWGRSGTRSRAPTYTPTT